MISTIIYIFLENMLEAVFLSLFVLLTKNIKKKRLLFIITNVLLYMTLKFLIRYNIWFQILYIYITYLELKLFYRKSTIITDFFIIMLGILIIIVVSLFSYILIDCTVKSYTNALILSRLLLFVTLISFNSLFYKINKFFIRYWNRHNFKNKIKSLTLRNICVISTNVIIFIISFWLSIANQS